jgi:uncharacterized protein (TIGR02145 family)
MKVTHIFFVMIFCLLLQNNKQKQTDMKKLSLIILIISTFIDINAQVIQTGSTPAVVVETSTLNFNNGNYRPSTLSYKGRANYRFVTGNTAFTNGSTVYVTFDPDNLPGTVSTTGVADGNTVFQCTVFLLLDANGDGEYEFSSELNAANTTSFVDGGTYIHGLDISMVGLTWWGPAIIGITDSKGANPVIIKKTPVLKGNSSTGAINGRYHYREAIKEGTILQNIIFDADGYPMVDDRPSASTTNSYSISYTRTGKNNETAITWVTSGYPWTSNRGTTWFNFSFSDPNQILIKNCTIRNIGGLTVANDQGNYAIIVQQGTSGQLNLEGLTIENCRGANANSFRLINIAPATNVNIKDISFIKGVNGQDRDLIWQESPNSSTGCGSTTDYLCRRTFEQTSDVRFAGSFTVTDYPSSLNRIGMQLTTFANMTPPPGYRYAAFSVGTTASTWSGSTTAADVHIYKSLSDFVQEWTSDNKLKKVIFDLQDSCWLVRPYLNGVCNATVDQQLSGINTVLTRLALAFPGNVNSTGSGRNLIMDANIKVVADASGLVPADFTVVPAYAITSTVPNIHIRMVPDVNTLWTDPIISSALVPIRANHQITLNGTTANIKLYAIDFHTLAQSTLHEVIAVPNATTYNSSSTPAPSTDVINARIVNAKEANFVACKFTGLVKSIDLTAPCSAGETIIKDLADPNFFATAVVDSVYTDTLAILRGKRAVNFTASDERYIWTSSDPTIATIDAITGEIAMQGLKGTTTIMACVLDTLNHGEIYKPCVSFVLRSSGCGSAIDYDNNTYNSVKLCNLCWFTSNLKSEHYADGVEIPNASVYQGSDLTDQKVIDNFGRLYDFASTIYNNGSTITSEQGICPDGWRLPTAEEWLCLKNTYNLADLKQPNTNWWLGQSATNNTGLSIVPGGYESNNSYKYIYIDGFYWIFDSLNPTISKTIWLNHNCFNPEMLIITQEPQNKYSVRCVAEP